MYCSNCSKTISDIADICPHCGAAVSNSPVRASLRVNPDQALKPADTRAGRNKLKHTVLPQDERMIKIISDFEIKTDVVYKSAPALRVYQAQHTYNPEPLYTPSGVTASMIILNILLTLLAPPAGLVRSVIFIAKKDRRKKDLGLVMLILSMLFLTLWVIILRNLIVTPK